MLSNLYRSCCIPALCVFIFLSLLSLILFFFFFNDTATTEIYTLSLHDALPICTQGCDRRAAHTRDSVRRGRWQRHGGQRPDTDRKSTRLNSSHSQISYAVFCLKKKNKRNQPRLKGQRRGVRMGQAIANKPAMTV